MAEFKLGRIRFVWQGPWAASTTYLVDDVVSRGGKSYICVINHTSSSAFATDFTAIPSKWNLVADGQTWRANWATSTLYNIGDLIKYGGIVYQCNTAHTSNASATAYPGGLEADQSKWDVFATGFYWTGAWATSTRYRVNDFVTYGGYTYVCKTAHVSNASAGSGLEADQSKWDTFNSGVTYLGAWSGSSVRYKLNDVVKYGADLWICTTQHTSTSTTIDTAKFAVFVNGFQFENSWNNSTQYQVGDTVTYGGYSYIAKTNNLNSQPTTGTADWDPFTTGFNFRGDWLSSTGYKVGDLIRLGGYTYVATADNSNTVPPNQSYWSRLNSGLQWTNNAQTYSATAVTSNVSGSGSGATFNITRTGTVYNVTRASGGGGYTNGNVLKIVGSSLGGISPANDLLITVTGVTGGAINPTGFTWTGYSVSWTTGVTYVLGDVVLFGANSYICVAGHDANSGNRPDADSTGAYWNLLASGAEVATLTTPGDTFYYGPNGPARLPVGTDGQILRVSSAGYPTWSYYGLVNNLVYVGPSGTDSPAPNYGLSIDKPWKTVRYAAKQVEDGYQNPNAKYLLQINKQFLIKEVNNYIYYTYKATASGTSSNQFTCTDTSKLNVNMPVNFTAQTGSLQLSASSISASTTYYIKTITANTSFTVSATPNGTALLATGTGTSVVRFAYDQSKTERDAGYAVDAITFDLSHGGNAKTTAAALAYYTAVGNAYITTGTQYEITQFISAQTYLKSLITSILTNSAPSTSYQTSNSVASPALQQINTNYTSETGATAIAQSLSDIIINGMSAGTSTAIAVALQPNTTISVKTGTFTEVLPIVVPSNTAIVGDELRGTVVQPATANPLLVNDKPKTISALRRIKSLIPSIVSNTTVIPTTGNTQTQQYVYQNNDNTATARINSNAAVMTGIISSTASVPNYVLPTPTGGSNNAFTAGYLNAARLVLANKQFLKDEVTAYMVANYSALWTSLGTSGQTNCTRDIGYIVDAINYDLTYGGNLATVIAARSYYSNGTFVEASNEKTATLAVQDRIIAIISNIAQGVAISRTSGNTTTQDVSGTAGSSTAGTAAVARITEIRATTNTGTSPTTITPDISWVSASLSTANTEIANAKAGIQANLIQWINKTYPTMNYNSTLCSRDAGYIIDALSYDMLFGSNFLSSWNALSYFRAIASAQLVLATELQATLTSIGFISASLKELAGYTVGSVGSITASTNLTSSSTVMYDIVNSGLGTEPSFVLPQPTGYNTSYLVGYGDGVAQITQNYAFIKADISQYISNNYNSLWTSLGATGQALCQRDIGYILDALQYDMTYGGNFQTLIAGSSYYSNYVSTIASTERTAILAAYGYLKTLIGQVVVKSGVSPQAGNGTSWVSAGTAGSAGAGTFASARIQDILDWITNGYAPSATNPSITWIAPSLQTSFAALQSARTEIQADTVAWVKKNYQSMNFNATTCSRDAGLIVDALSYDTAFGSNFNAITAGRSYLRSTTSAQVVYANQKAAELGAINFIKNKARMIVSAGGVAQASQAIDDITQYITGGAVPRLSWPNPSNINSGYAAGAVLLQDNKEFLKAEISAYMAANYSSVWTAIVQSICTRDVGYIVDALTYDLKYGGNSASVQAGKAYYSYTTLEIAAGEKAAMLASLTRLSTAVQAVIQDNALSVTTGNLTSQVRKNAAQTAGSSGAAAAAAALITTMYNIVNSGLTNGVPTITITTIAGTNTFTTGSAHGLKVNDIVIPQTTSNGLVSGQTYYVASTPLGTTFTLSATFNGLALSTFSNGTGLTIVAETTNLPVTSQVDSLLIAQAAALSSAKASIQTAITTYISTNFPTVVYNSATCLRDVGYIIDAVSYDLMLNSNYRSVKAGMSYYTAQASVVVGAQKDATINSYRYLKTQIATTVTTNATALSRSKALMNTIVAILVNGLGETPEVHGTVTYNNTLATINAAENLRANKNFLAYEATAWISANYGGTISYTAATGNVINTTAAHNLSVGDPVRVTANTVTTIATTTASSGNLLTVGTTSGLIVGMPLTFSGTTFGGVTTGTTYYVKSIVTPGVNGTITISASSVAGVPGNAQTLTNGSGSMGVAAGGTFGNLVTTDISGNTVTYYVLTVPSTTSFTVTAIQGSSTPFTLADAGGVATATYAYAPASCRRDMAEYIESIVYDLQYSGNYKSLRSAKLYVNAVAGSLAENMYLVRNGTGIRNQTMTGLSGYLTEVNEYNTKRPTAGAYTSLDPGFGPNDSNVWITTRSCYTQNCTMFGTACSGMKIDAALHTGGNKSIVANDYTTIISDGIGVWCTGSGSLTELVSVFNYYGYAGYFAELGGRMRATNGNSSYGTYGVIAEGTDTYEVPLYANLWNRGNPAQVTNTVTDGTDKILRLEFGNAGSGYTNYLPSISGAGYNAAAVGDEFRDSSIFETRIVDLNDGNGYGGSNYINAQNAAQTGDLVSITVAASDQNLSTAYVGMRVQIVGGTGVGQYGNILTYNNGSKIAQVWKDSVAPFTITATTNGTPSTVTVASTAQMYANMPFYVGTAVGGLSTATVYYVAAVLSTTTFSVTNQSGGTAFTSAITTTTSQSVTMYAAGWDHVIPGTAAVNALDLTTSYIIEPRINYTAPGFRSTARTLASTTTWGAVAYGQSRYVAITSNGTATTVSTDGKTWGAGGALATNTTYADVVYIGGQGATATATVGGLGGQGAVLTATLGVANTTGGALADQVASVTIVNGGYGYTTAPTIVFTSGTGSGATATCTVLNGAITGVTIVIPGSGYATAPTVSVATDRITTMTVNSSGRNYTSAPAITVSYPAGLSPTAWAATTSVSLNAYLVTTAGKIYQVTSAGTTGPAAPTHTSGASANGTASLTYIATQAQVTANMSNGGIASFTITDPGNSYTTTPTVTITDSYSRFVAIPTTATNASYAAATAPTSAWTVSSTALPSGSYASAAYGGGYLIAVGGTASATRSLDGSTWTTTPGAIPTTSGTYSAIAYGNGVFVAITTGANLTAYTTNGTTWTQGGNLPSSTTWTSVAYGNGRFVAIASGGRSVAYSLNNGATWIAAPVGLPSSQTWSKVAYGQGLFMAIAQGTTVCATSQDGVTWTAQALQSSTNWKGLAFGNINSNPLWVAVSVTSGTIGQSIVAGAQATGRIKITSNAVSEVRMIEPGSAYPKGAITSIASSNVINTSDTTNLIDSQPVEFTGLDSYGLITNTTYYVIGSTIVTDTSFKVSATAGSSTAVTLTTGTVAGTYRAGPIVTQFDPNKVKTAPLRVRNGDGAIANPSFTNRGTGNTTATASVTGDGYGDIYQPSNFINVKNMYDTPQAGANVVFSTIPNTWFKLVAVSNKLGSQGNYTATFQINPAVSVYQAPADGVLITTTLKYSQVRLTGHDFLYIGTGNKTQTNYPYVNASTASIANQAISSGGGRVFFTSTDQDGNFNVGNLFGVQQSTGTATLNASAFNLSGLQSLQLGQVAVGTGSAVITQFSTDPYFTANSDSILPTQRAIKAYITAQIGGGQSSLNVNTLTSGVIYVANNTISTTTGVQINVKSKMNFTGGIDGAPVALGYFLQK